MILKKFIKKLKKFNIGYFNKIKYLKFYRKLPVINQLIFLEAQNARSFNGNIYYIAKELNDNEKYKNYNIYLSISNKKYKDAKKFFKSKAMNNIKLIKEKTRIYYKLLATAQYLITDTSLNPCFIKKEGQIIFNTWHGTPFKTLGKKVNNEFHDIGNIQKNFIVSDYLLYPNEYMMDHMLEDYMIKSISNAEIILEGYPRNQVFFDEEQKKKIRKEEQIEDKQIITYMPTWRGKVSSVNNIEQQDIITGYLNELDQNLKDNQILYVNLHPFLNELIDFSKFTNIRKFPKKYETYEFLSVADCLITDYSSVFFDFANTKKKIILFTYDKEEYLFDRGLYFPIEDLPFPKVENIQDLLSEINIEKNYDDTEFIKKFCKYDNQNASKKLCEKVILGKNTVKSLKMPNNKKKNILIYTGNLGANGITTSLINILRRIDLDENNYFITFDSSKIKRNRQNLKLLPDKVGYIAVKGKMNLTLFEKIALRLHKLNIISDRKYIEMFKDEFKLERKRIYGDIKFSTVIQFNGYDYKKILLYSTFDDCNRVIYAHNDMYKEATEKENSRIGVLKYAYENYDKIALVTEDLIEAIQKITNISGKAYIANNIIDYKNIVEKSKEDVKFDEKTVSTVTIEELLEILKSNHKKFINIGRFSIEKGQDRLIDAFERLWEEDNTIYLIIIGGYGKQYNNILEKVEKMKSKEHIVIIKYVSNPYAILEKCDYLVLSSLYEGFGLVLAEADILGKPVISTDITGPRLFMKKYNGKLVENSTEGIYSGMQELLDNKIKTMNINYEEYNNVAIKQFYSLLNKKKSKK